MANIVGFQDTTRALRCMHKGGSRCRRIPIPGADMTCLLKLKVLGDLLKLKVSGEFVVNEL